MHLLIDADSLIYKAACPCETKMYILTVASEEVMRFEYKADMIEFAENMPEEWGDFEWMQVVTDLEPVMNALHALKLKLTDIVEETGCTSHELFLTKGDNFRHQLAVTAPYKGHRPPKPIHFKACFEYLVSHWGATYTEGLEADDIVAILQEDNTCIAHIDKDIDTVAGRHFNFDTYTFYELTEQEALCNFYRQFLVGDTSDNIKGVDGIGKVKAAKLLTPTMTEMEMFEEVSTLFDYDFTRLLETGRLLHMTRRLHADGSPVFWEFPVAIGDE